MKHQVIFKLEQRKNKNGLLIEERVPIYAQITFSGSRIYYFTGYRIDAHKFNPDTQDVKKNTTGYEGKNPVQYNIINKRLTKISDTLNDLFENIPIPDKARMIKALDKVCKKSISNNMEEQGMPGFFELFSKYILVSKRSEGSKRQVQSTMSHWERFSKLRNDTLTFDNIDADTLRAFEKFLKIDVITRKEQNAKSKKLKATIKASNGQNTISKNLKTTRAFWNFAILELKEKGINIDYPFTTFKIPPEVYSSPIYITIDELNNLFYKVIENKRLEKVRDIFVFQCMTGPRVGVLCKLTKDNISNGMLSYINSKNSEGKPVLVTVPLIPISEEVIGKYNLPDGRLLPFISYQEYNDYLKELFEFAGLTRMVSRQNPKTHLQEQVRICDIVSSHMGRRTFIGGLYNEMIDTGIISSMSGHVEGSKSFFRYRTVSEELKRAAMEKILRKRKD